MFHEFLKFFYPMAPSPNAITKVMMIEIWGGIMGVDEPLFEIYNEDIVRLGLL